MRWGAYCAPHLHYTQREVMRYGRDEFDHRPQVTPGTGARVERGCILRAYSSLHHP